MDQVLGEEVTDNVKVAGKDFKVEYVERRGRVQGILIADSTKAERLDWKPQYSLEQIVISHGNGKQIEKY